MAGPPLVDDSVRFKVTGPRAPRLDFGARLVFTSLAPNMPVAALENVGTGAGLFNSGLVPPAITFTAECAVAGLDTAAVRQRFDFGFVQGLKESDVHLDYWGRYDVHGRSVVHFSMPNRFEIDTDPAIQPFTRIASSRFSVTAAGSGSRVKAEFSDHPLFMFPHHVNHRTNGSAQYLRSLSFRRVFRTIFCARDRLGGAFTAIAATEWVVAYDHRVKWTQGGTQPLVESALASSQFPSGGTPSDVSGLDRDLLAMAKAGQPFVTAGLIASRLSGLSSGFSTDSEERNTDFKAGFWT